MQCSSCGSQNLPTSVRCYDCGAAFPDENNYLVESEKVLRPDSRLYQWLQKLPLPSIIIDGQFTPLLYRAVLLPFVWIPGLALWAMDYYERGLAYLVMTLVPLLVGLAMFNHWMSNWLIPLGFLCYIWSMVDGFYTWRERHYPILHSMGNRIRAFIFLVFLLVVTALLWGPQVRFVAINYEGYEPLVQAGDVLLVNPSPNTTRSYRRNDLVVITGAGQVRLGRILAFSQETIYHRMGQFMANETLLNEGMDTTAAEIPDQKFEIPQNKYLVLTGLWNPTLSGYTTVELLPAYSVAGRVEAIALPTENRKRLR